MSDLWVFDFDDTLVKTKSHVFLLRDGQRIALTPSEFVEHVQAHDDEFDFCEFRRLIDPRPIKFMIDVMRRALTQADSSVFIVSARSIVDPIEEFVRMMNLFGASAVALATADPSAKARWVKNELTRGGHTRLHFYDDSRKNVEAISSLKEKFQHVDFDCQHILTP